MSHTFKIVDHTKYNTLYDYFFEGGKDDLELRKQKIAKLKELQAPTLIIEKEEELLVKATNKVVYGKYYPTLTYKDGLTKQDLASIKITGIQEEYNRNDKLVAVIFNGNIRMNLVTRYCPILHKI